jgi:hypothetical protein
MRTPLRRLGAVATTTALALGGLLASPAQAAPNSYAAPAASWLTGQLTGGLVHNDQYDFDDLGLSLDVFFALQQLGTGATARSSILDAIAPRTTEYVGDGTERYAGATGKLATAVELAGRNPAGFGGRDLVTRLQARIHSAADAQQGRAVDQSTYGDYSNTIGQAWAVRALVGADNATKTTAVAFLLKQQCAAGFFRVTLEPTAGSSAFSCDSAAADDRSPSIDATALAVQALDVARDAGVTGLGDDIDDAADWLVAHQAADGSFVDQGTANTNSTGLAAAALALVGRTGAAGNAAAWVAGRQVTTAVADSSALRDERGSVAYDTAALTAGKRDGIPTDQRDQWRRATAQAAPALDSLLPARTLTVSAPSGYLHSGTVVTTTTSGLAPGEHFSTTLGSSPAVTGLAGDAGTATASFTLPSATRGYTVRTVGSRSARTGSAVVKVLAPTTLQQTLATSSVTRGGTQKVTVRGLASNEPVRLLYRGTQIWSGTATTSGTATHSFGVGSTTGKRKLEARGRFDDRTGTTYFTVR